MSEPSPVKIGVVGCGVIGKIHISRAAELPHVELTAVCDVREDLAKAVGAEFNVPFVTTDAHELIARTDLDAVVLALPTAYRFELAREVLQSGKHLLLEKPAAMNASQLEALRELQGDRKIGCCSCRLSKSRAVAAARKTILDGRIGNLLKVHCRALAPAGSAPSEPPPHWRLKREVNGGGIFVNWGCYDLDFLFSVIDWNLGELASVTAHTWKMPPDFLAHQAESSDAETHISLFAEYKDGLVVQYERAERATTRKEDTWQIIGDRGTLHLNMLDVNAPVLIDTTDPQQGVLCNTLHHEDEPDYNQHAVPIDDFCRAIQEDRPPQTSIERSMILQALTDAAYKAADSGRPVVFG